MSGQSIIRLITVILLQCMLLYELFIVQSSPLRWYEWGILGLLTFFFLGSVVFELACTEDEKSTFENDYFVTREFNLLILCGLLWKTFDIQSELPIPLTWALFVALGLGLFAVFNFLYYLIALLTTGSVFFILRHTALEGFWQYLLIAGLIAISVVIMISIAVIVEEKNDAEKTSKARSNNQPPEPPTPPRGPFWNGFLNALGKMAAKSIFEN